VYKGDEQTLQFNTNGENNVVKIQVPKGVENGATLRYENLIKDGVLIVEFRIHHHNKFQRHGFDLVSEQEISVLDLIVGTNIKFTTISGKTLDVKIQPKTQPAATLRIPGEGLPTNYGYGDQMILIKPFIPDTISDSIINSIILSRK
jgi:DnaJ-class molecular chaperone